MAKLFAQNKKILILAIGIGLILSLTPFYFAKADPGVPEWAKWCGCVIKITGPGPIPDLEILDPNPLCWIKCIAGYIISLPVRIIFFVIVGIFGIGALIAGLIYAITTALLNWLIGFFLSVGIVPGNPLTPQIVTTGWEFSRQFANMFFVLALAFIGLATILSIKEYEAKKALPTLIIIALLINFTPVIVGFVVDMGNLVTKFFLDRTGKIHFLGNIMEATGGYLISSIIKIFTVDGEFLETQGFTRIMGTLLGIAIYGLVLLIFFSLAGFIYLLIAAVFFCRPVVLWVLMILSPIAFLSKVFPDSKITRMIFLDILHWNKWWEKLIQWTIIGIPISFFLYLSNSVLRENLEGKFGLGNLSTNLREVANQASLGEIDLSTVIDREFVLFFTSLLAPVVSLMLLGMGALISFKATPEGAKEIMRFTTEKAVPTAISVASRGARTVRREFKNIQRKFQAGRALGLSRGQAAGLALQRYAQRRLRRSMPSSAAITVKGRTVVPAGRMAQVFRVIGAPLVPGRHAATGILKAVRATAMSKIKEELKIKKQTCPNCGETNISAKAKFCPDCGQPLS